jgi:hypothetical protein
MPDIDLKTVWWRALAAVAVVGLAGCGGGANASQVASVATTTSRSAVHSAPKPANVNPSQLLAEWGACMRGHGDPDQKDPSIDANKLIHIVWNEAIPGGYYGTSKGGHGNSGPGQYCRTYLDAAQAALRKGTHEAPPPSQAQTVRFSRCMRTNGIPDFPDPTSSGLTINRGAGGDLDPNNPAFQRAAKLCGRQTGAHLFTSSPQPGTIVLD